MAAARAVLQIGGSEYTFTRGVFGWRAGDENVSFEGDGKCVFRGLIHYVTEYTLWLPRATIQLLESNDPLVPMPLKNVTIKPIEDKPDRPAKAKGTGTAELQSWCPKCDEWHAGNDHVTKATAPTATGVFEAKGSGILDTYDNKFELVDGKFYVGIHEVKFAHNGACQFRALDTFLLPNEYVLWVPRYMIDLLRSMNKNLSLKPIDERLATTAAKSDAFEDFKRAVETKTTRLDFMDRDIEDHKKRIAELEEKLNDVMRKMEQMQTSDDAPVIV